MTDNDLLDQNVPLARLCLDGGTQSRSGMDDEAITEYTEAISHAEKMPRQHLVIAQLDEALGDG